MEILYTPENYILVTGEHCLWCSRQDGSLTPKRVCSLAELTDPHCIGVTYGIIGKFQAAPDSAPYLVVIQNASIVGVLPDETDIFKINRVGLLPLTLEVPPATIGDFDFCRKHHVSFNQETSPERTSSSTHPQRGGIQKTWNSLKTATTSTFQSSSRKAYNSGNVKEKYEQRLLDELLKMFDGTDSFYFSTKGDITNTLQRKNAMKGSAQTAEPWSNFDERFFWNSAMISEILAHHDLNDIIPWITPVIQGFVQIDRLGIQNESIFQDVCLSQDNGTWVESNPPNKAARLFNMILISRRSRYRAGTRYKRRGVDEDGRCANFVETEQIFEFAPHVVSFVMVRGSVPVFWSQPGVKYRPPPQLDRGEKETAEAFKKHFDQQLKIYGKQTIISLVENNGKEGVIARAYLDHVLKLNSPSLTYVSFDFHEYCRGMRFENVAVLINKLKEGLPKEAWTYLWMDGHGVVCEQTSVFRVNCIDCLDRTNVVETAIAREIMETQFLRLGLITPESTLPMTVKRAFQAAWANNGDTISRQYAGTAALKGDYTRTGSRRLSGLMKDGYNSANRYYLNRFRDAYRQSVIDVMLGNPVEKEDMAVSPEQGVLEVESLLETCQHEHVKQIIEDCKKMLISDNEACLGGWALINADPTTGDSHQDIDSILLLSKDFYCVAEYDEMTDRIIKFQKVLLEDLEKIEFGPEPSLFKSRHYCLRLHYLINGQKGFFHMFRCAATRLFNNVAIPISSEEEAIESLRTICESLKIALSVKSLNVPLFEGKLERRRSRVAFQQHTASNQSDRSGNNNDQIPHLELPSTLPRNISEGQLINFMGQVSTRALSTVSSQLSKLNPIRKSSAGNSLTNKDSSNPSSSSFGGSSQAILMTVAEQTGEEKSADAILQSPCSNNFCDRAVSSSDVVYEQQKERIKPPTSIPIDRTMSSEYSESTDVIIGLSMEELDKLTDDALLESCGILASTFKEEQHGSGPFVRKMSQNSSGSSGTVESPKHLPPETVIDDFIIDAMRKSSLKQLKQRHWASLNASKEALYVTTTLHRQEQHNSGQDRELSRSTEILDQKISSCSGQNDPSNVYRSQLSVQPDDQGAYMKTSHSESAIPHDPAEIKSPTAVLSLRKDLVLSPLSKIAKGMQQLGNSVLVKPNTATTATLQDNDEQSLLLEERKQACKSIIIEI